MRRMSFALSCGMIVTLTAVVAPVKFDASSSGIAVFLAEANAKNGGGGGGNGGGSGGGNGGGNSGGNGGGNSGKGGESRSNGKENQPSGTTTKKNAIDDDPSLPAIGVRHKHGITETVLGGRYIMRDGRGRTIVNRAATASDRRRIEALLP